MSAATGTGAVGRWNRIWYLDFTDAGTAATVDLTFDMSDGGMSSAIPATPLTNYKLLYRAGTSGAWTEVQNASSISGDRITFTGYAYTAARNDGYYTIGTLNNNLSPLPIELLSFNAILNSDKVDVSWKTATEINNDYFTIERSKDGVNFEKLMSVNGAGNSTSIIDYFDMDTNPYTGISYYRLKQTDYNGQHSYSNVVPVEYNPNGDPSISLFPNPTNSETTTFISLNQLNGQEVLVVLRDITGREVYSKLIVTGSDKEIVALDPENKLAKGTYLVIASSENKFYSKKLIVK
jgi:hypothetical protein